MGIVCVGIDLVSILDFAEQVDYSLNGVRRDLHSGGRRDALGQEPVGGLVHLRPGLAAKGGGDQ